MVANMIDRTATCPAVTTWAWRRQRTAPRRAWGRYAGADD